MTRSIFSRKITVFARGASACSGADELKKCTFQSFRHCCMREGKTCPPIDMARDVLVDQAVGTAARIEELNRR